MSEAHCCMDWSKDNSELMLKPNQIITVGICPCWDTMCKVDGLDWGEHKKIQSQRQVCAGKAFNMSRALAWLGVENTAAGLWGETDYQQMLDSVEEISGLIDIKLTAAKGQTRQNITVVDTKADREIHLRAESKLAGRESLNNLKAALGKIVDDTSIVAFAGSMPENELLDDCLSIIAQVQGTGAKSVIDTSGIALEKIIQLGRIWLIKPNIEELRELLGKDVNDDVSAIVKAAGGLCEKVEVVIVSRGTEGAVVVTKDRALAGSVKCDKKKAVSAVGCGDYLLAGFLSGIKEENNISYALARAVKVATARAWGLTEKTSWPEAESKIDVEVRTL